MDERTEQGRRFLMGYRDDDTTEFVSDQEKKLPQPPLCKAPMGGERTVLPRDFSALPEGGGLYDLLTRRRSARIYTEGELSLLQLSFLLWATQGVRAMRGRAYATLRTVPSGGAARGRRYRPRQKRQRGRLPQCRYAACGHRREQPHHVPLF